MFAATYRTERPGSIRESPDLGARHPAGLAEPADLDDRRHSAHGALVFDGVADQVDVQHEVASRSARRAGRTASSILEEQVNPSSDRPDSASRPPLDAVNAISRRFLPPWPTP
jgi:hypothetical protein